MARRRNRAVRPRIPLGGSAAIHAAPPVGHRPKARPPGADPLFVGLPSGGRTYLLQHGLPSPCVPGWLVVDDATARRYDRLVSQSSRTGLEAHATPTEGGTTNDRSPGQHSLHRLGSKLHI